MQYRTKGLSTKRCGKTHDFKKAPATPYSRSASKRSAMRDMDEYFAEF